MARHLRIPPTYMSIERTYGDSTMDKDFDIMGSRLTKKRYYNKCCPYVLHGGVWGEEVQILPFDTRLQ